MAANLNAFKTSKKDCILSKSHFSFVEVHCAIYRIREENKNFDDMGTLRRWQTRTHCCGNIVAHDVSLRTQTGKHLSRTQNVSEQNQKQLCPGHKICVRNKCCARGQTGKHFCRQQCVRNNVSSFASTFTFGSPEDVTTRVVNTAKTTAQNDVLRIA